MGSTFQRPCPSELGKAGIGMEETGPKTVGPPTSAPIPQGLELTQHRRLAALPFPAPTQAPRQGNFLLQPLASIWEKLKVIIESEAI